MTHTWKLFLDYSACPKCGIIIERRKDSKELTCPKCSYIFSVQKQSKQKPEFEWD